MEKDQAPLKSFFTEEKQCYKFYFDLRAQEQPTLVHLPTEARTSLEEALLEAIALANQQLKAQQLSLKADTTLYKVRLCGKNFKPKTDLPALSMTQKICDLKVQAVAVQLFKPQLALSSLPE